MSRSIYIHTINGEPGVFSGDQICYCTRTYGNDREPAYSLEQIKKEQAQSEAWRASKGYATDDVELGYVRYVLSGHNGESK